MTKSKVICSQADIVGGVLPARVFIAKEPWNGCYVVDVYYFAGNPIPKKFNGLYAKPASKEQVQYWTHTLFEKEADADRWIEIMKLRPPQFCKENR